MKDQRDKSEAVRHLVALGYVDPEEIAAEKTAIYRKCRAEFDQARETYQQGHGELAVTLLEHLVIENPDWIPPHQLLAEIHYWAGQFSAAEQQLDWLTWHGVETPHLSMLSGGIALVRRELPAAISALEYARHVRPELPGIATMLGRALLRSGSLDRATVAFRDALQRDALDVRALDGLAEIALRQGEYESAANLALEALQHDMQYWRAHYRLGVALAHMNRPNEAIQAFENCARLNPSLAAPLRGQARIVDRQLDDTELAKEYRQRGKDIIRRRKTTT